MEVNLESHHFWRMPGNKTLFSNLAVILRRRACYTRESLSPSPLQRPCHTLLVERACDTFGVPSLDTCACDTFLVPYIHTRPCDNFLVPYLDTPNSWGTSLLIHHFVRSAVAVCSSTRSCVLCIWRDRERERESRSRRGSPTAPHRETS